MRITYLVSRYPAISHTFIMREIEALRRLGLEVDTVTIRRPDAGELLTPRDREASRQTFAILPVGPMRLIGTHLAMLATHPLRYLATLWYATRRRPPGLGAAVWQLFYFAEAVVLAAHLRGQRIDHIHAHFANVAGSVAMLSARLAGLTWSMTLHGTADFGDPSSVDLTGKIRDASLVICVCEFGRVQAMLHSDPNDWGKLHVVHCGVEAKRYAPVQTVGRDRGDEPVRLLHVGRLHRVKGQSVLLEALRRLDEQGVRFECVIVGDGDERSRLESLAGQLGLRDRVKMTGSLGQAEVRAMYANADIFVLPSFSEGLPVVLMEAMAMQLPVVASRITGIPELVEDGVSGLLVTPGLAAPLADALIQLARDPELRERMGRAGRDKVCREFEVAASAELLAALFRQQRSTVPTSEARASSCASPGTIEA